MPPRLLTRFTCDGCGVAHVADYSNTRVPPVGWLLLPEVIIDDGAGKVFFNGEACLCVACQPKVTGADLVHRVRGR